MAKRPKRPLKWPAGTALPLTTSLPGTGLPYWHKIGATHDRRDHLVILSAELLLVASHFVSRESIPCFRETLGACDWCPHLRRVVQGWLPCWCSVSKEILLVCMTAGAVRENPGLQQRSDLAGRVLSIWRTGQGARGRGHVAVSDNVVSPITEDKVFDREYVLRVLLNTWGYEIVPTVPAGTETKE